MDLEGLLQRYEEKGIKVFPVGIDKKPLDKWRRIPAETSEQRLARFRRYQDDGRPFLIAALPGEHVVIDIDDSKAFGEFVNNGDPVILNCPTVRTSSGGFHYWLRNRHALKFASFPWGELRTGERHYCIVPGGATAQYEKGGKSIQGQYEWAPGPSPLTEWDGDLPDIPAELLARLQDNGGKAVQPASASRMIPEGQRNNRLTSNAGVLRCRGMGESMVLKALRRQNEEHCDPPLADKELQAIAESVCRYDPAPSAVLDGCADKLKIPQQAETFRAVPCWVYEQWEPRSGRALMNDDAFLIYQFLLGKSSPAMKNGKWQGFFEVRTSASALAKEFKLTTRVVQGHLRTLERRWRLIKRGHLPGRRGSYKTIVWHNPAPPEKW